MSAWSVAVPWGASMRAGRPTARPGPASSTANGDQFPSGCGPAGPTAMCSATGGHSPLTAPPHQLSSYLARRSQAQIPPHGATGTDGEVSTDAAEESPGGRLSAFVGARFRHQRESGSEAMLGVTTQAPCGRAIRNYVPVGTTTTVTWAHHGGSPAQLATRSYARH
jgi:hypothetical protein